MSYMDYNLSVCPFCGANVKKGANTWLHHDQHHYFSIACPCGAFGPRMDSKEKAMMAWNMREYSTCDLFWNPFDFQKDRNPVDLEGNLKSIGFSCVLQSLSSEVKTGVLQLMHAQKISALCLKDGQVIAASSNYGQPLGQLLFDKGLVSLEKLQKVLDKAKESGKRLGEVLLDLEYISPDALKEVIRQQISETIQGLILWEEGIFQFRDRPIEFDERGIENISVMAMMLDALRITDELADSRASNTTSFHEIRIV
jgi:hypothetical protein